MNDRNEGHVDIAEAGGNALKGVGDAIGSAGGFLTGLRKSAGDIASGRLDKAGERIAGETATGRRRFNNDLARHTADAGDAVGGALGRSVGGIAAAGAGLKDVVTGHGDRAAADMADAASKASSAGHDQGRALGESIADGSAVRKGASAIATDVHDAAGSVLGLAGHAAEAAAGAGGAAASAPAAAFKGVTTAIRGGDGVQAARQTIDEGSKRATRPVAAAAGLTRGGLDAASECLKGLGQAGADLAGGRGGKALDAMGEASRKAGRAVRGHAGDDRDVAEAGLSGVGRAVSKAGGDVRDAATNPVVGAGLAVATGGGSAAATAGLAASTAAWSASGGVIDATEDHNDARQARRGLAEDVIEAAKGITGAEDSAREQVMGHYHARDMESLGAAVAKSDPGLAAEYGL